MEPRVEGFEILSPLGSGAMSTVWRARESATGREVALKVLHAHVAMAPGAVDRFLHEVRAYERLRHPNVITCLRGGRSGEHWYAALELLQGGDLRAVLREAGALPPPCAAFVAAQVLSALAHAHRAGVVHRDVKPENVMIGEDGTLKLVDFGISQALDFTRLTEAGTVIGTPAYMAPEQVESAHADARSDLWSTGVVLYEMVTGRNPFAADDATATATRLLRRTPPPLGVCAAEVPEALEEVASRLLRREPAERPASADDVLTALAPVLAAGGPLATRDGFREFLADPRRARERWARERSGERLERARSLSEVAPAAACFEAAIAAELDPASEAAERLLAELAPRAGARGRPAASPRADELRRQAEESPSNLQSLVHLVRVARADGDLLLAARAYRWGRRRSADRFAAAQLANALGVELAAYLEGMAPEALRSRLYGRGGSGARLAVGSVGRSLVASRPLWLLAGALLVAVLWDRTAGGPTAPPLAHRSRTPAPVREADVGEVFLEKAAAVADSGDPERALAIYERMLAAEPDHPRAAEALFRAAVQLEALGRDAEAMSRLTDLLGRRPGAGIDRAARLRLVALLERGGLVAEALVWIEPATAVGDAEDRAGAALVKGRLLERQGEAGLAIELYDGVLAAAPPAYLRARALLGRGRAMLAEGDADAWRWLAEAVREAAPDSLVAREVEELERRLAASPPAGP